MDAARIIKRASREGVRLYYDRGRLKYRSRRKPPESLIAELRKHKTEIVNLIREKKEIPYGVRWCLRHKQELLKHGWTLPELFSRKITARVHKPGIAWLSILWGRVEAGKASVSITDKGFILFMGTSAGRDWTQTGYPDSRNPAYRKKLTCVHQEREV